MKHLLNIFLITFTAAGLFSCSSNSDDYVTPYHRTIIAFIVGDNNISTDLSSDISEMVTGSKTLDDNCRLVIYADLEGYKPYIAEIKNGVKTTVRTFASDFCSVNPDTMLSIMQWIVQKYPAEEYATILEGHGCGPIIINDSAKTDLITLHAYGSENNYPTDENYQWINIPSLAKVFSKLPHMDFIFFDACCMGNIETAYELRNVANYIIAPVCETPSYGAPYNKVVPTLSADKDSVGSMIVDAYTKGRTFTNACGMCMTDIKTSELENLRNATKTVLKKIYDKQKAEGAEKLNVPTTHAIYYYREVVSYTVPVLHDMKSLFRLAMEDSIITQEDYDAWDSVFDKVIIAKSMPQKDDVIPLWITNSQNYPVNFYSFRDYFDEDHYGALSMIVPTDYYDNAIYRGYPSINETMFKLSWSSDVGWHEFGW